MAVEATPPFQNPLERIEHTVREIPVWMGRHWKSLTLTLAALGGAGYVSIQLARPYTPDTQVKATTPASDAFKPADPGVGSEVGIPAVPETPPTATASPKPPEPTPTQEAIKGVINNKTANLVDLPSAEVQKIVDQAKTEGKTVIALPDWVRQEGVEIREFTNSQGKKQFAITAPNGKYELPALTGGKIVDLTVGSNHTFNVVAVSVGDGEDWFAILPVTTITTHKLGEEILAGQTLVTIDHDPNSKTGQYFQKFLKTQVATNPNGSLPDNTLAIIGLNKTDDPASSAGLVNLNFQQLAKDEQNNIVVTSSK